MLFRVRDEIAVALELAGVSGCFARERCLDFCGDGFHGIRVDDREETAFRRIGILHGEEPVVEAHLGVDGGGGIDPMDGGLADDSLRRVLAGGVREKVCADQGDLTGTVFLEARALDDGAAAEADVFVRGEAEILFLRDFLEVLALDVDLRGE